MVSTGMKMSKPWNLLYPYGPCSVDHRFAGMIEEKPQPYAFAFAPNTRHVHAVVPKKISVQPLAISC